MQERVLGKRYELLGLVGNGGMADVYKAHDKLLDRMVAVKILHPQYAKDDKFIRRFQQEAQAAARMSHPGIVNIYDVGHEDDFHYIVMEYVSGDTLKNKLEAEGRLPVSEALRIAKQIAEALEHAHKNGLVHCDIKPHNILMMADGRIKVADFGIARAVSSATSTYAGNVIGSVHYFSPEQAKGAAVTPKSDVYSLGVVLYEMLTGQLPFTGETTVGVALKQLQEEAPPIRQFVPTIPPYVEALVAEMMSKDPLKRPDSAAVVHQIMQDEAMLLGNGPRHLPQDPFATQLLPRVQEGTAPATQGTQTPTSVPSQATKKGLLRSKPFVLVLFLILLAGFFTGAFLSYGKFWSGSAVTVPDVTGQTLAVAKQKLEDLHLRVDIAETYDSTVPAGQVVSQDPQGGSTVKEDRLVTLYISKGSEEVTVPDLRGMTQDEAQTQLEKLGLALGQVTEEFSSQKAGQIISQDPRAGKKIEKGQTVDLVLSKGPERRQSRVPNTIGMTEERAAQTLSQAGFHEGSVTKEASKETAGTVIRQSPSGGDEAENGASVDLVLAEAAQSEAPAQKKSSDSSSSNSSKSSSNSSESSSSSTSSATSNNNSNASPPAKDTENRKSR